MADIKFIPDRRFIFPLICKLYFSLEIDTSSKQWQVLYKLNKTTIKHTSIYALRTGFYFIEDLRQNNIYGVDINIKKDRYEIFKLMPISGEERKL